MKDEQEFPKVGRGMGPLQGRGRHGSDYGTAVRKSMQQVTDSHGIRVKYSQFCFKPLFGSMTCSNAIDRLGTV